MKYNKEQQDKISKWLVSVGASYEVDKEYGYEYFNEYKDGQLLEIAERNEDSLLTWDEWQHLQIVMGMELSLNVSKMFVGVLWENDIDSLELVSDVGNEYYKKIDEKRNNNK